jgi:hypothetical protein
VKNVKTTLIGPILNNVLSAGGTYLFVYDGTQFQLQGSGGCTTANAGLVCGSTTNFITLFGGTSGVRSYTTEAVAPNDTLTVVGYNSAPTSGNCAQWSASGGAPVLAQSLTGCVQKFLGTAAPGSVSGNLPGDLFTDTTNHNQYVCNAPSGTAAPACTSVSTAGWMLVNGSSGGSPVTSLMWPLGGFAPGPYPTTAIAANAVLYFQVFIPSPGITLHSLKAFLVGSTANAAWGVYDSSCNVIAQSPLAVSVQSFPNFTFSSVPLAGGTYYFAHSSDSASLQWYSSDRAGYGEGMSNVGETATTYKIFLGSNASTTSGGVTTLPSSCGTRTLVGDITSASGTVFTPAIAIQ